MVPRPERHENIPAQHIEQGGTRVQERVHEPFAERRFGLKERQACDHAQRCRVEQEVGIKAATAREAEKSVEKRGRQGRQNDARIHRDAQGFACREGQPVDHAKNSIGLLSKRDAAP